jgi:cytidylate kinase
MSLPPELLERGMRPGDEVPPRHGFRGDQGAAPTLPAGPQGLSIAVSREAGARGGTIARRVASKLGWQVYDQELMEYMAQDSVVRQGLLDGVSPAGVAWAEARLAALHLGPEAAINNLARLVLALGAQGEVVLIGRGAGCILPPETTLNVRIVAPLEERIAYMAQWLRLPLAEATDKVRSRDARRAELLEIHFARSPGDVHQYDMVLNSSLLGEEACADLIAQAAHVRWTAMVEGGRR